MCFDKATGLPGEVWTNPLITTSSVALFGLAGLSEAFAGLGRSTAGLGGLAIGLGGST